MTYEIEAVTKRIIGEIYRDGHPQKAILAGLRNSASLTSSRAQIVWPILMANLNQNQLSRNGVPTRAEVAVYTAIRFYAIHQQGQADRPVYAPARGEGAEGATLFSALAQLRKNEDYRVALDRRVQPLLATTNVTSVIHELSHLVQILKARGGNQKVDYAWLAQDLYGLQGSFEQANRVRLLWGQQYFRVMQTEADTAETKGEKN